MMERAEALGLAFDREYVSEWLRPDPLGTLHDNGAWEWFDWLNEPRELGRAPSEPTEDLHGSARTRLEEKSPAYAPANVLAYLERGEAAGTGGSLGGNPDS